MKASGSSCHYLSEAAEDYDHDNMTSRSSTTPAASGIRDVSADDDEHQRIRSISGYQSSNIRLFAFLLASLLSAGVIMLLARWFPATFVPYRYRRCSLSEATLLWIEGEVGGGQVVSVIERTAETAEDRWLRRRKEKEFAHISKRVRPSAALTVRSSAASAKTLAHPMFIWRYKRFMLDPNTLEYKQVEPFSALESRVLHDRTLNGLSADEQSAHEQWFGQNVLTIVVPTYAALLVNEVFHPFYVFQIYSVILWCFELYYIFAVCIAVIATVSIVSTLLETRARLTSLSDLAYHAAPVTVIRGGEEQTVDSRTLVPGDIVLVDVGVVPCDIAIIDGGAVVNESMLTGESVPVVKSRIQWPLDRLSKTMIPLGVEPRNTLSCATNVLQLKPSHSSASAHGRVLGIVVRTGFSTTKGALILSILYPKPSSFRFVEQSYKFVAALFGVAMIGFGLAVWQLKTNAHASNSTIIIRACDLITIVVPPSLPLALSVGTNFALIALKQMKIFCISPNRINMAGKIKLMCFDKTGTLTADSLEFVGVFASENGRFTSHQTLIRPSERAADVVDVARIDVNESNDAAPVVVEASDHTPISPQLICAMSTCHSLAVLDGRLIGDPLEIQIFNATTAQLSDSGADVTDGYSAIVRVTSNETAYSLGIVELFEFSSGLQRMSVVFTEVNALVPMTAIVKGSPEMILSLCVPSSVPADYTTVLGKYTHAGYRVIAIASKLIVGGVLPQMDKNELRGLIECDLTFLGLLLLENKVKAESAPTLAKLHSALVRCVMVTGDNPLTAVTVAKECGLVVANVDVYQSRVVLQTNNQTQSKESAVEWVHTDDDTLKLDPETLYPNNSRTDVRYELAVTGTAYELLQSRAELSAVNRLYFQKVLVATQIFARMTPNQKADLVAQYQALGIYTGMCGDGANDCGALKTAHVGVSLSESEASIAAPFTYQEPNITCIPSLLSQGRSSLITSFQLFKYMAMYSMIQFSAAILTYFVGSVLGNFQYLWADMYTVFPLTIFMGATQANPRLSVKRPSGNLLSYPNLFCVVGHVAVCMSFQVLVFLQTQRLPDYVRLPNPNNLPNAMETTSLYYFSNFQYVFMAALFAMGSPWKLTWLTNYKFTLWILLVLVSDFLLVLVNNRWGFWRSDDVDLSQSWRTSIVYLALMNAAVSILFDVLLYPAITRLMTTMTSPAVEPLSVFGRLKRPTKLYHCLRGEFECGWFNGRGDIEVLGADDELDYTDAPISSLATPLMQTSSTQNKQMHKRNKKQQQNHLN